MAYRKSNLSTSNQSKTKAFVLNKCFSITKTLFNCKSTHHALNKNGNYEFISYGEMTNKCNNETEPISSTMIEYNRMPKYQLQQEYNNNAFESSQIEDISNISASNGDTLCESDMEVTRRQSFYSNNSNQTDINYETLTIVKESNKSPISNIRNNNLDLSINSVDCLHSTKIESNDNCSQCLVPQYATLSPRFQLKNSLESSSSLSLTDSPVSSSSQIESFNIHNNDEYSNQLSIINSMISNLSIVEDEETQVCTNNYEATFVDDVTVHFADTVRILRDNKDEWLYVQVVDDGRQGFVPRTIVLDLNQFIQQLKQHKDQLTRSKISLLDFPFKV